MRKFDKYIIGSFLLVSACNSHKEYNSGIFIKLSFFNRVTAVCDSLLKKLICDKKDYFTKRIYYYPTIVSDNNSRGISCVACTDTSKNYFIPNKAATDSSLIKFVINYKGKFKGKEFDFTIDIFSLKSDKNNYGISSDSIKASIVDYLKEGEYADGITIKTLNEYVIAIRGETSKYYSNLELVSYLSKEFEKSKKIEIIST